VNRWLPFVLLIGVALVVAVIVYWVQSRPSGPVVTVTTTPQPTSAPIPVETTAAPGAELGTGDALTLTLISWNVESGGALQPVVASRIAGFDQVDIWGLSEVLEADAEAFEFGAEEGENANFDSLLGTTGGADRLLLIWNADRFVRTGGGELTEIAQAGRAPLYVQLQDRATGQEFIVMVNHLHRSNESARHIQAQMLNEWAANQPLPVVAMGDYNFDWDLDDGDEDHDRGYDFITANDVFVWLRPEELVTTQCSGWPCRFTSVLDFFFVSGPARDWDGVAQIVVVDNDFPDDNTTPDHRPLLGVLTTAALPPPPPTPTAKGSANLRAGPGNDYALVGRSEDGQPLRVVAQDATGNWLQLEDGRWIATFFVNNPPIELPIAIPDATPIPGGAGLRLGTIFFDGDVPQVESDEYVEVVNDGEALNVAGWQLTDGNGRNNFTFPDYTMEPGEACRVYTDEVHTEFCGFSFDSPRSIWTNSGDMVVLINPAGNEVERQCWGNGCE
jgi:hypothetical protein